MKIFTVVSEELPDEVVFYVKFADKKVVINSKCKCACKILTQLRDNILETTQESIEELERQLVKCVDT